MFDTSLAQDSIDQLLKILCARDIKFKLPGVAAVLCTDGHGLCLGAKGSAPKHSSGPIATLAAMAGDLSPSNAASPVVCIESEAGSVLIKSCENLTVAVFKAT